MSSRSSSRVCINEKIQKVASVIRPSTANVADPDANKNRHRSLTDGLLHRRSPSLDAVPITLRANRLDVIAERAELFTQMFDVHFDDVAAEVRRGLPDVGQ